MSGFSPAEAVAVIPARGGSKGVPGKNVAPVGGVPLVARAVAAALAAGIADVRVSTDDARIAAAARAAGAGVIDRPADLAGDTASSEAALLHALDVLAAEGVEERAALLRAAVEAVAPEPAADYLDVLALVERLRDDSALVRAEQLPGLAGCSLRTLQRRFCRLVGVGPKWVMNRFRLQEAALALERDPDLSIADLAARLGWYDQAHFSNDFQRILGVRPARYAAAARGGGSAAR